MASQLRKALLASVVMPGLLVAFLAVSPSTALGQETCYTPHNCGPLYYTIFEWEQAGGNDRDKPWDGCEQCWIGGYPMPYFFCAIPCVEDQEQDAEQVAVLLEAVENDDLKAVLAMAPLFPSSVAFHQERQAIQIKSCGGSIIVNLPLAQDRALAILARRLVTSGSLSVVADK